MTEPGVRLARPGTRDDGRMAIVAAASAIFSERGYAATTIDDIADRLGATKGRVYHYYRSKADIFLDVHRVALTLMLDRMRPLAEGDGSAAERLKAMASEHASLLMREFSLQIVAVQGVEMHQLSGVRDPTREAGADVLALRDEYERLFVDVITDGIAAAEMRDAPARLLSKAILGSLNWITMWYRPRGEDGSRHEIADEFATFVVRGVLR